MRFTFAQLVLALVVANPGLTQELKQQQVDSFFKALADSAQAGDRDRYTALFSSDAAMFLPNRPPLQGRAEIGEWFEKFRDTVVLVLDSYEQEQIKIVGEVAMVRSRGVGHYLVKATGERLPFDQKYLDILQFDDGEWTMVFHVASSSLLEPGLWDRDWER